MILLKLVTPKKRRSHLLLITIFIIFTIFLLNKNKRSPDQLSTTTKPILARDEHERRITKVLASNQLGHLNIITVSTMNYHKLVLNWIVGLLKHGYTKFVVFCLDSTLYDLLATTGHSTRIVLVPASWHEKANETIGNELYFEFAKLNVIYRLCLMGHTILNSDNDHVWLSSHIVAYVELHYTYTGAELIFATEQRPRELTFNMGFFYATPTSFVKRFFSQVINGFRGHQKMSFEFHQHVMRNISTVENRVDKRLGTLDPLLIASGEVYFRSKLNSRLAVAPLVVHANHVKGQVNKTRALKALDLWLINN